MKKLIFALVISLSLAPAIADSCYSEGMRVGTVQKFSQKGYVNKSWEGELVMEGTTFRSDASGNVRAGNVWKFSVLDANVAKVIDEAAMQGNSVAIKYCQISPIEGLGNFTTDTRTRAIQAVIRK